MISSEAPINGRDDDLFNCVLGATVNRKNNSNFGRTGVQFASASQSLHFFLRLFSSFLISFFPLTLHSSSPSSASPSPLSFPFPSLSFSSSSASFQNGSVSNRPCDHTVSKANDYLECLGPKDGFVWPPSKPIVAAITVVVETFSCAQIKTLQVQKNCCAQLGDNKPARKFSSC